MVRHPRVPSDAVWRRVLSGLILLGVVAALWVAVPRAVREAGYRTVEVIIDAESVFQVASHAGVSSDEIFGALRDMGVTSVTVTERTVEDALAGGTMALVRPGELAAVVDGGPAWLTLPFGRLGDNLPGDMPPVYLLWQPGALDAATEEALTRRLGSVGAGLVSAEPVVWEIPARTPEKPHYLANPAEGVKSIGMGFDPAMLQHVAALGLRVALRPLESPGFGPEDVDKRLEALAHLTGGGSLIVFDGAAVPGESAALRAWSNGLSDASVPVAWIEFAVQRGLDRLIRESRGGAVRLHSIGGPELHGLQPDVVVARWLRAVVERSVRALYVRFYTEAPAGSPSLSPQELLELNLAYVDDLTSRLEDRGFTLGPAEVLRLPTVGFVPVFLLSLSVAAALVCLLRLFVRLPLPVEVLMLLGIAALLVLPDGFTGRRLGAFCAAVAFPTLATVWTLRLLGGQERARAWIRSLLALGAATLISLVGALHVAGLLSETPFAIGIDLFWGVKAMHVIPPALVGAAILWEQPVRGLRDALRHTVDILRRPIPFGYVLALGALAALALLVVLRTGTDLLPVPGLEQWLRTTLEEGLGVRPRNKEFLLGHPLFVVTAFLVLRRRPPLLVTAAGAALASIGQLSLVNTFAHIHAPLATSLVRTVYGVVLGGIIGLVAVGVVSLWVRLQARSEG